MAEFHGKQWIGGRLSAEGKSSFKAYDPRTGNELEGSFLEAGSAEAEAAALAAGEAFDAYRRTDSASRADFLDRIAGEIMELGDFLVQRCSAETGLPEARIVSERGRTTGQLRLFAELLREGSWVDARIDLADPARQPLPRPDLRSMLVALGPVAVFGASNFPLAFSVAGGDSASALAAGCPIIAKAHPSHPGTCELIAGAITRAIKASGMPEGVFSMIHSQASEGGLALVKHPQVKAVGFTGSLRGGRALFDAAAARPEPIPVYAEMGSSNPVFILAGALGERAEQIAQGLASSMTLGVGQFCTSPGLVFLEECVEVEDFTKALVRSLQATKEAPMLNRGIWSAYRAGVRELAAKRGIRHLVQDASLLDESAIRGTASLFQADLDSFLADDSLQEEVFGPSALMLPRVPRAGLEDIASGLHGHLTASVWGNEEDLKAAQGLFRILETKVGRIIVNAFPTGVEVSQAMVHGGPYPSSTDSRSSSVGTIAIRRFARPVCYQSFPQEALPPELQNLNPKGISRLVNGRITEEACG